MARRTSWSSLMVVSVARVARFRGRSAAAVGAGFRSARPCRYPPRMPRAMRGGEAGGAGRRAAGAGRPEPVLHRAPRSSSRWTCPGWLAATEERVLSLAERARGARSASETVARPGPPGLGPARGGSPPGSRRTWPAGSPTATRHAPGGPRAVRARARPDRGGLPVAAPGGGGGVRRRGGRPAGRGAPFAAPAPTGLLSEPAARLADASNPATAPTVPDPDDPRHRGDGDERQDHDGSPARPHRPGGRD